MRNGRGFRYVEPSGRPVDDEMTLGRIRALVIPPAWNDVWICPHANGHIQAVGTDAAGRRQYRYHDAWRERRDAEKFARLVEFGHVLPALRSTVEADLALPGMVRERVLALGVRLLDIGMFRIGGEAYAEEHETYGLATLEKRHAQVRDGLVIFDYVAKGGKRRRIEVADDDAATLIPLLKRRRGGGRGLLAWREGRRWVDVSSHDLNVYLKDLAGDGFSAKDFRTWGATVLAAVSCAEAAGEGSASPAARRRRTASVFRSVADVLGNTPAVCRKSYVDPRVLERFVDGDTIAAALADLRQPVALHDPSARRAVEEAVLALLEDGTLAIAA